MRITISKRQSVFLTPSEQPEGEEATLEFEPLTLAEEAELVDSSVRQGGLGADLVNKLFKKKLIGWEGIVDENDDDLPFDPAWSKKVPDKVVLEFDIKHRYECISRLLEKAELKSEDVVGKSA